VGLIVAAYVVMSSSMLVINKVSAARLLLTLRGHVQGCSIH
jgi:hypothetical protein